MGHRRERLDKRQANQTTTRRVNSVQKDAQRDRRDQTMLEIIRRQDWPYTSDVMNWLSQKLDKKASRITPEDVKTLAS